jgi:hypothetical protein
METAIVRKHGRQKIARISKEDHFFSLEEAPIPHPPPSQKHIKEKPATQRGERLTEKVVTIAMLNVNLMRRGARCNDNKSIWSAVLLSLPLCYHTSFYTISFLKTVIFALIKIWFTEF